MDSGKICSFCAAEGDAPSCAICNHFTASDYTMGDLTFCTECIDSALGLMITLKKYGATCD